MRALYPPYRVSKDRQLLNIRSGGTTADNKVDAASKLGLLTKDMIGKPLGLIALDSLGRVMGVQLGGAGNITSPSNNVPANGTLEFKITDYDFTTEYHIGGVNGAASRVLDTITFTADNIIGKGALLFNGRNIPLNITSEGAAYVVDKPSVVVIPPKKAKAYNTFMGSVFKVTASDSSDTSGFRLTESIWTLYTADGKILEQETVKVSLGGDPTRWMNVKPLLPSTSYKITVEYHSEGAVSNLSGEMGFSTKTVFIHEVVKTWTGVSSDVTFGYKAVISGNGQIVAISEPDLVPELVSHGTVYIYERGPNGWSEDPVKVYSGDTNFGVHLDISDDGNTLLVGDDTNMYIYKRLANKWSIIPVTTVPNIYRLSPAMTNMLTYMDDRASFVVGGGLPVGTDAYLDYSLIEVSLGKYVIIPGTLLGKTKVVSGGYVVLTTTVGGAVETFPINNSRTVYKDINGYYLSNLRPVLNGELDPDSSHASILFDANNTILPVLTLAALALRSDPRFPLGLDLAKVNKHINSSTSDLKIPLDVGTKLRTYILDDLHTRDIIPYDVTKMISMDNIHVLHVNTYSTNKRTVAVDNDFDELVGVYPFLISPDGKLAVQWTDTGLGTKYKLSLINLGTTSKLGDFSFDHNKQISPLDSNYEGYADGVLGEYIKFSKNSKYLIVSSSRYSYNNPGSKRLNVYDISSGKMPAGTKYTIDANKELCDMGLDDMYMLTRENNTIQLLEK